MALWSKIMSMFILHRDILYPVCMTQFLSMLTNSCSAQLFSIFAALISCAIILYLPNNKCCSWFLLVAFAIPFLFVWLSGCFVCKCMRETIRDTPQCAYVSQRTILSVTSHLPCLRQVSVAVWTPDRILGILLSLLISWQEHWNYGCMLPSLAIDGF